MASTALDFNGAAASVYVTAGTVLLVLEPALLPVVEVGHARMPSSVPLAADVQDALGLSTLSKENDKAFGSGEINICNSCFVDEPVSCRGRVECQGLTLQRGELAAVDPIIKMSNFPGDDVIFELLGQLLRTQLFERVFDSVETIIVRDEVRRVVKQVDLLSQTSLFEGCVEGAAIEITLSNDLRDTGWDH